MEKLIAAERIYFCRCCMFGVGGDVFAFFMHSWLFF